MEVLFVLIPLALLFAFGALYIFLKATFRGQFDDCVTPAQRVLMEDSLSPPSPDPEPVPMETADDHGNLSLRR